MRLAIACTVAGLAILHGAGAAPPPRGHGLSTRDLALLTVPGDEAGSKLVSVDGVPLERGTVGLHPDDAPAGMNKDIGVWLTPGHHKIHARYVHNIVGGMSLAQGDVALTMLAGHTYMVHPIVTSDRGKIYFSLADYGKSFPLRCLPSALSLGRAPSNRAKRGLLRQADVLACKKAG